MPWTSSRLRGEAVAFTDLELVPHQPLSERFLRESDRLKDLRLP
jgi:hypothetical protein